VAINILTLVGLKILGKTGLNCGVSSTVMDVNIMLHLSHGLRLCRRIPQLIILTFDDSGRKEQEFMAEHSNRIWFKIKL
jgi:hypothetical protein